jgi:hypothetical protein
MEPVFHKPEQVDIEAISRLVRDAFDRLDGTQWSVEARATFFPISPEFEYRGTIATRIALWLPYYDSLHERGEGRHCFGPADASVYALNFRG